MFVEDGSVAFGMRDGFQMLSDTVSPEEIGVDHIDVASFVKRMCDLVNQGLTHDIIVELPGSTYIEGESPHLSADFALVGLLAAIFRTGRGEFNDEVFFSSVISLR